MDREVWWATAHRVRKESDTTEASEHSGTVNIKAVKGEPGSHVFRAVLLSIRAPDPNKVSCFC